MKMAHRAPKRLLKKIYCTLLYLFFLSILNTATATAQTAHGNTNAWYMYYWDVAPKENHFGLQGDIQLHSTLENQDINQLLLRGGVNFRPSNTKAKYLLGYAYLSNFSHTEGHTHRKEESRVFQEALFPQMVGHRLYLAHRLRVEERWLENSVFRSRLRYNLFTKWPINHDKLDKGTLYLAFYNELFLNGPNNSPSDQVTPLFDRLFSYAALGYCLNDHLKVQCGFMEQFTAADGRGQFQLSFHHRYN